LSEDDLSRYWELIDRRASGEPLQYITGWQEFFGLEFEVTPDVLIPRPETELIVEAVIRLAQAPTPAIPTPAIPTPAIQTQAIPTPAITTPAIPPPPIIAVCTGSGCIAVTLAREFGTAKVIASDISPAALGVAKRNAARHGLAIEFLASDLLDA